MTIVVAALAAKELEDVLVGGVEVAVAGPHRDQQAARPAAKLERRDQRRQPAQIGHLGLEVVEPGVRVGGAPPDQVLRLLARRGDDLELGSVGKQQHRALSADHPTPALDDQLQQAVQLDSAGHGARDVRARLEAAKGLLELARPRVEPLVQAGVLDRHARPRREHHHELLVGLVELGAPLLLGQVEVSPGVATHQHRGAEEAPHLGVVGGKP